MFGIIVPGQPVLPASQVAPDRFLTEIPSASINHVVIFLTGLVEFPEGFGCSIHVQFPGKDWQFIGGLSNLKPSAIFKLRNSSIASTSNSASSFSSSPSASSIVPIVSVGILCEPLQSIELQLAVLASSPQASVDPSLTAGPSTALVLRSNPAALDPIEISTRLAKNLYNSVAGYAETIPDRRGTWVDLRAIEAWYEKIGNKIRNAGGIGFLSGD